MLDEWMINRWQVLDWCIIDGEHILAYWYWLYRYWMDGWWVLLEWMSWLDGCGHCPRVTEGHGTVLPATVGPSVAVSDWELSAPSRQTSGGSSGPCGRRSPRRRQRWQLLYCFLCWSELRTMWLDSWRRQSSWAVETRPASQGTCWGWRAPQQDHMTSLTKVKSNHTSKQTLWYENVPKLLKAELKSGLDLTPGVSSPSLWGWMFYQEVKAETEKQ